jgi:hypothetical protein
MISCSVALASILPPDAEPNAAVTLYAPVSTKAAVAIGAKVHCLRLTALIRAGHERAKTIDTATETAPTPPRTPCRRPGKFRSGDSRPPTPT